MISGKTPTEGLRIGQGEVNQSNSNYVVELCHEVMENKKWGSEWNTGDDRIKERFFIYFSSWVGLTCFHVNDYILLAIESEADYKWYLQKENLWLDELVWNSELR